MSRRFDQPRGATLADYYAEWIERQVPSLVRKAQRRDYERHWRGYILPILGTVPLAELRRRHLEVLQRRLLTEGRPRGGPKPKRGKPSAYKPLSPKRVKNIVLASFRAVIQDARADELVPRNLFERRLKWPASHPPDADPFDADERTAIVDWFARRTYRFRAFAEKRPHPPYHALVHLLFWTGVRPSEAAGLEWQHVDLKRGVAWIRQSRHLGALGDTKTKAARRWVQLFPATVEILRAIRPLRAKPETPVVTNTDGGPVEPNSFLADHWYAALTALGIRQRGLYAMKDTFVTTALYRMREHGGIDIPWLERQTGVAYQTLKRHYAKWWPEDRQTELEKFRATNPELFGSATATTKRRRAR